ncbi:DUF294 nucleotidyltransferase-like domain-containing protein [Marinospirillum alkaliphilum]|uniref:CBS domain-containing protein n=1 Tax=Marinospirillum alkaliphilum DSM 21637 TaxID=1122209 RepID=A0A1K1UDT4_9GAMM|nr:DUF294 nucleotidyltransferase-like domain-containing protein [Marinospirillum alkaliphilum]SFX11217.1 CBS domain-containing protein [Marinospirillum alkaliphilum DSM 21637]
MQFLSRSSPWRQLFQDPAAIANPQCMVLPALQEVFADFPQQLQADLIKPWQQRLVRCLQQLDLPAWRISQLISDHNDWLYRQALDLSLAEMRSHGWGEPPVSFCVLQLGSAARHESLLRPDQDNAMILADYPDARHQEVDTWFQHLGEGFTHRLDESGIPLCKGHVMARWPLWRKRLAEWKEQMRIWTAGRIVKRVQLSNILLDFRPVYGEFALADDFRQDVLALMPRAQGFLHEMAELLNEIPVALDAFDRLVSDGEDAPHAHALNLKRYGLLPLQSAVRLLCLLQGGIPQVATRDRLLALVATGQLTTADARDLTCVLESLQSSLLQAQMASLGSGRQADGWIDLELLSEREKVQLKADLKLIRNFVRRVRKQLPALSS